MAKILVIEDTKDCLEGMCELLELEGHEVTGVDSGQKAIDAIKGDFDIIFCDIIMPGITGWNILMELRQRGIQTPFVYITALATDADRMTGRKLGADWYIYKPYKIDEIKDAIERLTPKPGESI